MIPRTEDGQEEEILRRQAELCRALADPKRLMMLHVLREGPRSVGQLAGMAGLKQSNASAHLGVLRRAGVVRTRRQGNVVYYSLATPRIADACDTVRQVIAEEIQRSGALGRAL